MNGKFYGKLAAFDSSEAVFVLHGTYRSGFIAIESGGGPVDGLEVRSSERVVLETLQLNPRIGSSWVLVVRRGVVEQVKMPLS